MRITYRPALATDINGIAMAHVAAHGEAWRGLVEQRLLHAPAVEDVAAIWDARFASPDISIVVAESSGEIIGAGACGDSDGRGVIHDVLVLRAMQCRGVGTRLMGLMACDLKARGHDSVSLWAPERNVAAIVFFRAIGGAIVDAAAHGDDAAGLPKLQLRWDDLDELAFWNGSVSPSPRAQKPPARGGRSPLAEERTAGLDACPPTSGALPRG